MSCQVKLTATIADVDTVKRVLFPTDDSRGGENWLESCKLSLSPTGDLIAIARLNKIVTLIAKWDSSSSMSRYQILYSGLAEENDFVRAVLCVPVVSHTQISSSVGPDWTCIALGYESGYVKFYTDNMELLFQEKCHNEKVCGLHCQSQHSPRPDLNFELKPEEVYVQYITNICVINGVNLFNVLRANRAHLAKGLQLADNGDSGILNVKKWGFVDQFAVNDVAVAGLDFANTFDHLLTASTCGGFETRYRAMPPHNNLVLGVGSKPYVGFHYAIEGGTQPVLTDVAKAVANKIKSVLPVWLTRGRSPQAEKNLPAVTISPADPMGCRFGICDLRRTASSIILSPDRHLAAITDTLGRVNILDTRRGVIIRMLKGYRDSQCSFIQVPDEKKSKHRNLTRVSTFLAIYTLKKGSLEIYSVQQGHKIATFTASKSSKLLHIGHGLMGFNTTSKSRYVCQFTGALFDPDGQIKEVVIPFHFALKEKSSKRLRDLHLYKRLKSLLRTETATSAQIRDESAKTCSELKTAEIKTQCLEMLINFKPIDSETVSNCAAIIAQNPDESETFAENVKKIVELYDFCGAAPRTSETGDAKMNISARDMSNLQRLLDLSAVNSARSENQSRVTFVEDFRFDLSRFLSSFELRCSGPLRIKGGLDDVVKFKTSELIFGRYVSETFPAQVVDCGIKPRDLIEMAFFYWVNRPVSFATDLNAEMARLSAVLYALVSLERDSRDVYVPYNETSAFWAEIRELLADSARPFPALTAALVCKSVAHKIDLEKETQLPDASLDDENFEIWEKLSQENCEWMILIGKLEDVSLLNIILSDKSPGRIGEDVLPKLKLELADVSLRLILERGRGAVSELVSKWLSGFGVDPKRILQNASNPETDGFSPPSVFNRVNLIRNQFPYSLQPEAILANLSWEYALAWKNETSFKYFDACFDCLSCIPDPFIKQGIYSLLWSSNLKQRFENVSKLINKVGKLPKEKLCRQDTDLTDFQIAIFVEKCTNFLDTFMDAMQQNCGRDPPVLKFEALWENGACAQPTLIELALQQNNLNYDLIHLHYQLSLALQMVTKFGIKQPKPLNNLFDNPSSSHFFTDLQQKAQIFWHKNDQRVHDNRTRFLIKVISASIETLVLENEVYSAEHVVWMSRCLSLAKVWNVDVDSLKRFQIAQLFTSGFDALASELIPAVVEMGKLAPDLLSIAGKRMSNLLAASEDLGESMSALSPALTRYLNTLNGDWCAPCPLEAVTVLVSVALTGFDENQPEYKLANQLLEACHTLEDLRNR